MSNEIGVKLGGDNSGFRSMLQQSEALTARSLGKFGDFGKAIGVTDGSVLKLAGRFGLVGAAVAGVVGAFSAVLKHAEGATHSTDANVQATKRLAEGVKESAGWFKTMKDEALGFGAFWVGHLARAGEYVGRQVAILANGREQVELGEKIEKQTIETLAALEKNKVTATEIGAVRKQIAAAEEKARIEAEKQLDIADRTLLANSRLAAARDQLRAAEGKGLDTVKAQYAILMATSELEKVRADEAKAAAAAEKKRIEDNAKATEKADQEHVKLLQRKNELQREAMGTQEKIWELEESIRTATEQIAIGKKKGYDVLDFEVALLENAKDLTELRKKLVQETTAAEKQTLLVVEDLAQLSKEDLQVQRDSIQARIAKADAEGQVTDEMRRQLELVDKLIAKKSEELQITLRITGATYDAQSDSSLKGALSRAKSELQRLSEDQSFRSVWSPNGKDPRFYLLQQEVAKMEAEIAMRSKVGDFANRFGEDAARFQYGDTVTDRALRSMQDTSERTLVQLREINQRLEGSKLFPKSP